MNKAYSTISYLIGALCIYFSVFPYLLHGVINIGSAVIFFTACFFLLLPKFLYGFFRTHKFFRLIILGAFSCFFVLSALMLWTANVNIATTQNSSVVVVLGAKTSNGKPSTILKKRLDKAVDFYDNGFNGTTIVCGKSPESDTMKNYLVEKGISADKIIKEDKSTTTEENIFYASVIIKENNMDNDIAIASDGFHQLRSHIYAKKCGLSPKSISSFTPPILLPSYWVRDMGGVVLATLNV